MSALAHPTPAPPSIPAGLLEALIDPTRTLPAIAREHGLSMADLLRFMAGPECRRELDLALKAATERTRLVASLALPKAAESLSRLIHQIDLDAVAGRNTHQDPAQTRTPTPTPISECLRKCISLLARLTRLSIPARLSSGGRPNLPPPARSRPAPPASLSAMLSACLGSVSSQIADPDTSSGSDTPPVQSDVNSETAISPVQSDVSRETGAPPLPSLPDAHSSHTSEPTPRPPPHRPATKHVRKRSPPFTRSSPTCARCAPRSLPPRTLPDPLPRCALHPTFASIHRGSTIAQRHSDWRGERPRSLARPCVSRTMSRISHAA